jgi:DNA-binding Xre family transcriptional regulator
MQIRIDIDTPLFKWQARHNERMTYVELARRAGITIPTFNRIKSGKCKNPDLRKIAKICEVLECDPSDIFVSK